MERQKVKKNDETLITNDANDYAKESIKNPAYPLELLQRGVTVSLETKKLIKSLPEIEL